MNDNFFEELNKQDNEIENKKREIEKVSSKNSISTIYKTLSWIIIILGLIAGILVGVINENVSQFFTYSLIGFGIALSGFALAEIIQILHDIRSKLYEKTKK